MEESREETQRKYHEHVWRGYMTKEDHIDMAGAGSSPKIRFNVAEQLKGESKKRWLRLFGDC